MRSYQGVTVEWCEFSNQVVFPLIIPTGADNIVLAYVIILLLPPIFHFLLCSFGSQPYILLQEVNQIWPNFPVNPYFNSLSWMKGESYAHLKTLILLLHLMYLPSCLLLSKVMWNVYTCILLFSGLLVPWWGWEIDLNYGSIVNSPQVHTDYTSVQ